MATSHTAEQITGGASIWSVTVMSPTRMGDPGNLGSQGCFQGMALHPSPGRPERGILSHSHISLSEILAMVSDPYHTNILGLS